MTEHSDERRALADIISLATVLSDSVVHAFSKECVGGIADELRKANALLPEKRSLSPKRQAEDGSVVKRFTCFEFDQYPGIGERIPVID